MLGAGRDVVGVTHECDYPKQAQSKPRLVNVAFDVTKLDSSAIDRKIAELLAAGEDIFKVDVEGLKMADPDLVVTQSICEVCSPFAKIITKAVDYLSKKPEILILDPSSFDDVIENINEISIAVDRPKEGRALVKDLKRRISGVRANSAKPKPRVLCLEWLDPPYSAGHWIPQMVETAGGINGISTTGERSRRVDIDEIRDFDPDKIILIPCGFGLRRTLDETVNLDKLDGWKFLRAVKEGEVYVVDANSYFSKPGPRTVTGLEILANIIRGEQPESKIPKHSYKRLERTARKTKPVVSLGK